MLAQLRERVAKLEDAHRRHETLPDRMVTVEGCVDSLKPKVDNHSNSIERVSDFHKTVKISYAVVAAVIAVVLGTIYFCFIDNLRAIMKMSSDYTYCQDHRAEADKPNDCVVLSAPSKNAPTAPPPPKQ